MRVLLLHLVFTLPGELRTSLGVPTHLDYRNTTLLQTLDLTIYDFNGFFNEVQFVVNLDFIQWRYLQHNLISQLKLKRFSSYVGIALLTITSSLDTALDLNYLLGCLMDDLWASELSLSNLSRVDSGVEETLEKVVERLKVLESEENATLKKKLAENEVLLDLTRIERDRAETRLSESICWNERFYLEMVRKGAVPKPPFDDEGSKRPRKMPKKSDEDEGPFDPRGPLM
nr:hypothetical protein [Tanacetum cinerariifolium]